MPNIPVWEKERLTYTIKIMFILFISPPPPKRKVFKCLMTSVILIDFIRIVRLWMRCTRCPLSPRCSVFSVLAVTSLWGLTQQWPHSRSGHARFPCSLYSHRYIWFEPHLSSPVASFGTMGALTQWFQTSPPVYRKTKLPLFSQIISNHIIVLTFLFTTNRTVHQP